HRGEDPPVFCPGCAGVRRLFARVDDDSTPAAAPSPGGAVAGARVEEGEASRATGPAADGDTAAARDDGFVYAIREDALRDGAGVAVEIDSHTYALFQLGGKVTAVDGLCPHAGGPLAEGSIDEGVVTCPWHGWTFDACTGCSLEPPAHDLARYPALVEGGNVYLYPKGTVPDEAPGARNLRRDRDVRSPHGHPAHVG
ncbi:MAG: Rieske 2Fe-2S domain-containing protein, partial [Acidobacteria bacterium]|nr:Rieske 2Fe-2S domain-containing protein [Acidobacteriota bacterium]